MTERKTVPTERARSMMGTLRIAAAMIFLCAAAAPAPAQPLPAEPSHELKLDCGNGQSLRLILIPAGEFMMGSPKTLPGQALFQRNYCVLGKKQLPAPPYEQPQHRVRI